MFALHELEQNPTEKVRNFFERVQTQCVRINKGVNKATLVRLINQALEAKVVKERRSTTVIIYSFYQRMIFVSRLHAKVWTKVVEVNKKMVNDTLEVSVEAKTMIGDLKGHLKRNNKIFTVQKDAEAYRMSAK